MNNDEKLVFSDGCISVYCSGERQYRIEYDDYSFNFDKKNYHIINTRTNSITGQLVIRELNNHEMM